MKIRLFSLAVVVLCAFACSAPKMAYKFDYHDYNAGRKAKDVQQEVASNPGPAHCSAEALVAMESTNSEPAACFFDRINCEACSNRNRKNIRRHDEERTS
ncbi:MAG: hypothetical protein WDO15_03170 [Bacteroidota bacterium]